MNLFEKVSVITFLVEFIIGNFANVFIALVNCIDWIKSQRISAVDWILTALAISRIGLLCTLLLNLYLVVLNKGMYSKEVSPISFIIWLVANHFSTWLATVLSMFYLLKIANFSNVLFLYLKRRVESVVLMILFGGLLILLSNLMLLIDKDMWMKEDEGNMTWKSQLQDITRLSNEIIFTVLTIVPFLLSLICVVLLIYSLCKHLRNMRLHGKGFQDPSTDVHVKALQTMLSFLLLYAMYFLCIIITSWLSFLPSEPIFLFCHTVGTFYPSSHSCLLIWGNKKLKQAFLLVLWQMRCWLKQQKSSSP